MMPCNDCAERVHQEEPQPDAPHKFEPSRDNPDRCAVCGEPRGAFLHQVW